jgi:hypothetical protein
MCGAYIDCEKQPDCSVAVYLVEYQIYGPQNHPTTIVWHHCGQHLKDRTLIVALKDNLMDERGTGGHCIAVGVLPFISFQAASWGRE